MKKITKIGVLSLAKFQAAMMGALGLLGGVLYAIGGFIFDMAVSGEVSFGTLLAFGALIGMPLLAAAYGFVLGVVTALLYNIIAKWIGGIKIELE